MEEESVDDEDFNEEIDDDDDEIQLGGAEVSAREVETGEIDRQYGQFLREGTVLVHIVMQKMKILYCFGEIKCVKGRPTGYNAYARVKQCGVTKCPNCSLFLGVDKYHLCFVKPSALSKSTVKLNYERQGGEYVFYYIETMKDIKSNGSSKFVPNLVVCHHQDSSECVFKGLNSIHLFCNWLFKQQGGLCDMNRKFTLVAHNASGFDLKFILEWLATHLVDTPKLTVNGQSHQHEDG